MQKPLPALEETTCLFPIEYQDNTDELLLSQGCNFLIGQYAFGATAGHSFLRMIIDNIVKQRIAPSDVPGHPAKQIFFTTGPVMVTQTYLDYQKKADIQLVQPTPFKNSCFGDYATHLGAGTWPEKRAVMSKNTRRPGWDRLQARLRTFFANSD